MAFFSKTSAAAAALLLVALPALAQIDTERILSTNNKSGRTVVIPRQAVQVADNVFSLGSAVDPGTGKLVEGYMVLDNRRMNAKGGSKGKPGGGSEACYAFLASGAKWKGAEEYLVDTYNNDGLSDGFVRNAIAGAVAVWDNEVTANIFGAEGSGIVDGVDTISPDGKNEVLFADIDSPGTVGVTIVWGIFRGQIGQRQLVEWDQAYDHGDYDFGDATLNAALFDLPGVAAHEVGHAAGMGHPSDSCSQETMYRFVAPGETHQRDLHTGDIAGIKALY